MNEKVPKFEDIPHDELESQELSLETVERYSSDEGALIKEVGKIEEDIILSELNADNNKKVPGEALSIPRDKLLDSMMNFVKKVEGDNAELNATLARELIEEVTKYKHERDKK